MGDETTIPDHEDHNCLRCGYDLTSLDDRQACPECGLIVGLSRRSKTQLSSNHPQWLGRLTLGTTALALAILLSPMLVLTPVLVLEQMDLIQSRNDWDWRTQRYANVALSELISPLEWVAFATLAVTAALPLVLFPTGVLLLGRRRTSGEAEPFRRLFLLPASLVVVATIAFVVPGGLQVAQPALKIVNPAHYMGVSQPMLESIMPILIPAIFVLSGYVMIVLSLRLRVLAERAPAPLLAADSPIVGVVAGTVSILFGLWLGLSIQGITTIGPRGTSSDITILLLGIAGGVGGGALIWSIYLLVRYSLAFNKTRHQAASLFRDSDLSLRSDASAGMGREGLEPPTSSL